MRNEPLFCVRSHVEIHMREGAAPPLELVEVVMSNIAIFASL